MATEEIEISQLELAENLTPDMVLPVEGSTDTKATSLQKIKEWLGSFFVDKTSNEIITGQKKFTKPYIIEGAIGAGGLNSLRAVDTNGKGETKITSFYAGDSFYSRLEAKNQVANLSKYIEVRISDNGEVVTGSPACSARDSIVTTILRNRLANGGYITLGNGLIIQYGYVDVSSYNATGTVTFQTPFELGAYGMGAVGYRGSNGQGALSLTSISKTGFSWRSSAGESNYNSKYFWLIVGF